MDYYRIIRRIHADTPMAYGKAGARWNPRHVPMIYAASSVSLAMTEYLSIKGTAVLTTEWSLVTYSISKTHPLLEKISLPDGWNALPYALATQRFGEQWAKDQTSVCLKVPSTRLPLTAYPREHNMLINPLHPDVAKVVSVKDVEELSFLINKWG